MKNFVPREYYSRFYEQSCINSDTMTLSQVFRVTNVEF